MYPTVYPTVYPTAPSMEPLPGRECRVAVVGSGMAGLATAYLLNRDPEHRYKVEVFEIVRATPNLSPDTE